MKRAFDVLMAAVLLLAVLPVLLVAVLGSALSLQAWPFFTQTRVGLDGRPLRIVKIRTLPPSAPRYADKYAVASIRLPWFPRLLRRLHLDELPQLFLVLTGAMSIVGPRPEMPQLHAAMDPEFAARRTSVRPGCTGLWQVSDACGGLIGEAPHYDDFYVRNQSLRLDWLVARRTFRLLLPFGTPRFVTAADLEAWGDAEPAAAVSSAAPAAAAWDPLESTCRHASLSIL